MKDWLLVLTAAGAAIAFFSLGGLLALGKAMYEICDKQDRRVIVKHKKAWAMIFGAGLAMGLICLFFLLTVSKKASGLIS